MKSLVGATVALAVGAVLAVAAVFGMKAGLDPDHSVTSSSNTPLTSDYGSNG